VDKQTETPTRTQGRHGGSEKRRPNNNNDNNNNNNNNRTTTTTSNHSFLVFVTLLSLHPNLRLDQVALPSKQSYSTVSVPLTPQPMKSQSPFITSQPSTTTTNHRRLDDNAGVVFSFLRMVVSRVSCAWSWQIPSAGSVLV
jgi:hypothetical protein